jgi:WD40 repeat protein
MSILTVDACMALDVLPLRLTHNASSVLHFSPPPHTPLLLPVQHIPQDRTLRLWNPVKGLFIKEYRGHGYEVRDVSVCADNSKMASVGGDRQVCVPAEPGDRDGRAMGMLEMG